MQVTKNIKTERKQSSLAWVLGSVFRKVLGFKVIKETPAMVFSSKYFEVVVPQIFR